MSAAPRRALFASPRRTRAMVTLSLVDVDVPPPLRRLPPIFTFIRPTPLPAPLPAPPLAVPRVIPATPRSPRTFRSHRLLGPRPTFRTQLGLALRANFG